MLWTAALVGMMSYMVLQIVTRINEFLQVPRAVNMNVRYDSKMKFPAITFCNNNVIR